MSFISQNLGETLKKNIFFNLSEGNLQPGTNVQDG